MAMAAYHVLVISLFIVGSLKNVFNSPVKRAAGMSVNTDVENVLERDSQNNGETLEEPLNSEAAVMEGDMIVSTDRNAAKNLWPDIGGQIYVPYTINPNIVGRTNDIKAALDMVTSQTCVSFYVRKDEQGYVEFTEGNGCASNVGYLGKRQVVILGPPCSVGNIAHEVLHTLGFHHEHTRKDRQQYIDILYGNIMGGKEGNFQEKNGNTQGLPYDINSIMHYGGSFFSVNGEPTIKAKGSAAKMGQRTFLTDLDVDRVRRLYRCDIKE
ncbi:astacin-like metalloendopeptidase isoform X2 [Hypomesus transpacificus]|uniref:astacin-like metalloendopeptidase isoform X2 n=1 Tax=Hypomesus transpacificus TaxID=137520 RepID=UPI001F07A301|nr:astacin-like metalloendopeptidase isoform X2 [Hypomesus transpacificus]